MAGSVYPIEDGKRYRGVLTLKNEFGISFRKTFTGKDPKKVQTKMNRWETKYKQGIPAESMTVEKMCGLAIEAAEKRGAASKTTQGYRTFLEAHIKPVIGAVKVHELNAAHIEHLMSRMATGNTWKEKKVTRKNGKTITVKQKPSEARSQLHCRNFMRMAINRVALKGGFVTVNVAALADPPKVKRLTRRSLEPLDLEKILEAEEKPVVRALWLFLASTGLRPGEARNLLWRDLVQKDDGYWIALRESKTEEGKLPVPIPKTVMEELELLEKTGLYVFSTASGAPFNESNLRREWIDVLKRAKLPYTNLYQLRKLFGTLKARKVSDSVLKRLMRHTDARTTKQYYVSAIEEDLRSAVED